MLYDLADDIEPCGGYPKQGQLADGARHRNGLGDVGYESCGCEGVAPRGGGSMFEYPWQGS